VGLDKLDKIIKANKKKKTLNNPTDELEKKIKSRKIFASVLGAHIFVWLIHAAGVTWWWKGIPYIVSAVVSVIGFCVLSQRSWYFSKTQRLILIGFLVTLLTTLLSKILTGDQTALANANSDIFVNRSWWNTFDQLIMLVLLAVFFLLSVSITRYVPNGRVFLGFGIIAAMTLYSVARIFTEKILLWDFYATGDYAGFSNKNAFGHLLNIGFIFSLAIALTKSHSGINWLEKFIAITFCLILGLCIVLNNSRGGLVSLVITLFALIFLLLFKKRKKENYNKQLIIASVAIILTSILAALSEDFMKRFDISELSDYRFRYTIWADVVAQLSEIAVFGTGIQSFRYRYNSTPTALPESIVTHAESSFLTIAYEQGLIIALLFAVFLFFHLILSILQKNRSLRASMIGVGITSLIIIHGMFETLTRFCAFNLASALFLGMLHGQRAIVNEMIKLKPVTRIKPFFAASLGLVFSWGILLFHSQINFKEAYRSILSQDTDKTAWNKTQIYLNTSWDEFERTSELTYAWRERAHKIGVAEDGLCQKIADISYEQLSRQLADPLAWLSLGFAQAASQTLLNKHDPTSNLQRFILRLDNISDSVNKVRLSNELYQVKSVELIDTFKKLENLEQAKIPTSSLIEPASTRGVITPGHYFPDWLSFPFISDDLVKNRVFKEINLNKMLNYLLVNKSKNSKIFYDSINEECDLIVQWLSLSIPYSILITSDTGNLVTKNQAARSFANANAIYPELLSFYKEALGVLALYNPQSLNEYYDLLTLKQRENLWKSWQRYLVYDPSMRTSSLLDWISMCPAPLQIRLKAARMKGEKNYSEQILILQSIFNDTKTSMEARLSALDTLITLVGPEILEKNVPSDLENTFELRARRLLASYNTGNETSYKYADELCEPSYNSSPQLIVSTVEALEKLGRIQRALEICRHATELTKVALKARLRTDEIRRRISEAAVEPTMYLGRLSVLSRTEDAQPEEILDFINLSLLLDLHVGAREYLETKTPRGLSPDQQNELDYYSAKIAARDRQAEKEIQLHKQILSRR
jgi:hypothetical protein